MGEFYQQGYSPEFLVCSYIVFYLQFSKTGVHLNVCVVIQTHLCKCLKTDGSILSFLVAACLAPFNILSS